MESMEGSSSSSSLSFSDASSFDGVPSRTTGDYSTVKFLCSYGGRILPRYPDGKLRYIGGYTRLLHIHRSIPFSELQLKLQEICGWGSLSIRCQLPDEELDDTLVSITSDEDLANLLEEYDILTANSVKIRAFLFPALSKSPRRGPAAFSVDPSSPPAPINSASRPPIHNRTVRRVCAPSNPQQRRRGPVANHGSPGTHQYLVYHGNHLK